MAFMLGFLLPGAALAGLSPAGVLVLFNADDPDAEAVALHYAEARDLVPRQLCPVFGVDPEARSLSWEDYVATVQPALHTCLDAQPDPAATDVLVTVRGLPPRVDVPGYHASLQAVLQVEGAVTPEGDALPGADQTTNAWVPNPTFLTGSCAPDDLLLSNPYDRWYQMGCVLAREDTWPRGFRRIHVTDTGGFSFEGALFVVGRLDGFDHDDAHALIDRGVAADGVLPTAPMLCMEAADEARGARDPECERVVRLLQDLGAAAEWRTPHDSALTGVEVSAYLTGAAGLTGAIDGVTYAPGAYADNLTSYGAVPQNFWCDGETCPGSESQTSIARFVRAGATGAYGTVAEPLNNVFPNASVLLYYQQGYSLGESVLYSQQFLYWQGLLLGDPLTTPFVTRPIVTLPDEVAEGEDLVVTAEHADGLREIRLYVDGLQVARSEADTLSWSPGRVDGEVIEDVLAVASRRNPSVSVAWEVGSHRPRPDVNGWARSGVRIGPPPAVVDTTDSAAFRTGKEAKEGAEGCGCAAGSRHHAGWLVLWAVAGLRRRS